MRLFGRFFKICAVFAVVALAGPAGARDAAFMDPGVSSSSANSSNAVTVEPKSEIDVGEAYLNIARRVAVFFVNQTSAPIDVINMAISGDGNVTTTIISDDCSKENKIAPNSRCSVVVSIMPTSGGPWSAELLLTHGGAGRIARAKISGKVSGGQAVTERKDMGLALSSKEVQPINFSEVEAGTGRAVRSALMVNDSADSITIMSIDLIAAENGLERLEQGCSADMDLKAGESCPITLVWKPESKGSVSTDLIVRHSGKLGFVVIPVRGTAKEASGQTTTASKDQSSSKGKDSKTEAPPTADELDKITSGKIPQVSSDALGGAAKSVSSAASENGSFRLIGTVGSRAVLLKPNGSTTIAGVGEEIAYGGDKFAKVTEVTPKIVELFLDGKKKLLPLEEAEELIARAAESASTRKSDSKQSTKSSSKGTSSK
ncbi:MAG: hypothetical protein PHX43_04380 [Alphaproteobacteria bacterium]|nr:hypothetical protein [Alphaproteobacteria bacterium]